ncbi:helix-turn-helix domain-containing protein [Microbacterium sp.]|uniref:PucR family transcriptional regulator n=1 Tax=Microbacterium sp. TaxID=51671 RepID=UPI003341CA55
MIEDLGTTLLDAVCGDIAAERPIDGVIIHDPLDDVVPMREALVLGVGLSEVDEITALLSAMREEDATALVLRAPIAVDGPIAAASAATGVPVLALTRGASWSQLSAMLRTLTADGDVGQPDAQTLGGTSAGDLFAIANAISTLLDAPVTIEDRNSRVLAFSGRQEEADPQRVETILSRQVPDRYSRELEERGVFRELYRSADPISIDPVRAGGSPAMPRVACAVRAGDEVLGSIWVAVREPLSSDRLQALKDATKLVALHMLQQRAGADVERRLRADLLATALEGGAGAKDAVARLRLGDHRCVVLALSTAETAAQADATDARVLGERHRIADAFAMHLGAVYPRSAVAMIGDVVYAVAGVPGEQQDADARAARVAEDFLSRLGSSDDVLVAVGAIAENGSMLPDSRQSADRALRVLRSGRRQGAVVLFSAVQMEALLVEVADLARTRGERPTGPVGLLIEHDRERGTHLVETLQSWLECLGDVTAASTRVYTHPNTFRYRLRRLSEISGLDLADPDARFSAMVQLRLLDLDPR